MTIYLEYKSEMCSILAVNNIQFLFAYNNIRLKIFIAEKTVHNIIVFYDEDNKDNAQYLVDKMEHCDNFITKKYFMDFSEG